MDCSVREKRGTHSKETAARHGGRRGKAAVMDRFIQEPPEPKKERGRGCNEACPIIDATGAATTPRRRRGSVVGFVVCARSKLTTGRRGFFRKWRKGGSVEADGCLRTKRRMNERMRRRRGRPSLSFVQYVVF